MKTIGKVIAAVTITGAGTLATLASTPVCSCFSNAHNFSSLVIGASPLSDLEQSRTAFLAKMPPGSSVAEVKAFIGSRMGEEVLRHCIEATGELKCRFDDREKLLLGTRSGYVVNVALDSARRVRDVRFDVY